VIGAFHQRSTDREEEEPKCALGGVPVALIVVIIGIVWIAALSFLAALAWYGIPLCARLLQHVA
jgi:hypothetical protein